MRIRIPRHGDKRIKKFFAIFPVKAKNQVRWLEKVVLEQIYLEDYFGVKEWKNERFIDDRPEEQ